MFSAPIYQKNALAQSFSVELRFEVGVALSGLLLALKHTGG